MGAGGRGRRNPAVNNAPPHSRVPWEVGGGGEKGPPFLRLRPSRFHTHTHTAEEWMKKPTVILWSLWRRGKNKYLIITATKNHLLLLPFSPCILQLTSSFHFFKTREREERSKKSFSNSNMKNLPLVKRRCGGDRRSAFEVFYLLHSHSLCQFPFWRERERFCWKVPGWSSSG